MGMGIHACVWTCRRGYGWLWMGVDGLSFRRGHERTRKRADVLWWVLLVEQPVVWWSVWIGSWESMSGRRGWVGIACVWSMLCRAALWRAAWYVADGGLVGAVVRLGYAGLNPSAQRELRAIALRLAAVLRPVMLQWPGSSSTGSLSTSRP